METIFSRNYYGKSLRNKTVAVIGCGGIGSYAAEIMARAGVNLILVDHDLISESNLGRQNYTRNELGEKKVNALKRKINSIAKVSVFACDVNFNDLVKCDCHSKNNNDFNDEPLRQYYDAILRADAILSAVDSLDTKIVIDEFAAKHGKVYVHASAQDYRGEILFFKPGSASLSSFIPRNSHENASLVMSTLPTIIGLFASTMILNYLSFGLTYENFLYRFNLKTFSFDKIKLKSLN